MAERLTPEQIKDLWPPTSVDDPVTLPGLGSSGASNVWAVGDPAALANDPHLGLTIPNTWYLARIETPEGVLAGATAPGVPFMVLGHNGSIAWGLTTPYTDTADVVTQPEVVVIRREEVAVRWGESVELELRRTRKGAVVSDFTDALPEGWAVESPAFRDDDRTAEALGRLNRARDWPGFLAALRNFHSPQQNIVYADRTGRIGIVTPGRVPDRRGGFEVSGETTWSRLIPFDRLPRRTDPRSGRIVNANNRLVDETYPYYLGREWNAPYRAIRIHELLNAQAGHAAIQNDTVSLSARELLPHLLAAVPDMRLRAWDGDMDRHRPEPLIYMAWMREAMRAVFADELGPLFQDWWAYRPLVLRQTLLDRPAWCDDVRTKPKETCRDRLALAHRRAVAFLQNRYGSETPPWGERLCCRSSCFPRGSVSEDSVEDCEELSCDGGEGSLFGFSLRDQVAIEAFEGWVMPGGGEGSHVEGCADVGASSPYGSLSAHGSAVAVEGRDADERGDAPSAEGSEFGEIGDQGSCGGVTDPGNAFEEVLGLAPCGGFADRIAELGFEVGEFALQGGEHAVDAADRATACEAPPAVSLRGHHRDDLAPPGDQLGERAGLLVRHRTGLGMDRLGELCDRRRIEGVGLGEPAGGAGEVPDLARVDHRQWQARRAERRRDRDLEAARRLQHHEGNLQPAQARRQLFQAFAVARDGKGLPGRAQMHVQTILRHVDANEYPFHVPSLQMRSHTADQATVRVQRNSGRGTMLSRGLHNLRLPDLC